MEITLKAKNLIITSGGQSGTDRAALDFAMQHKIPCGGWCPAGRLAEDGIIPDHYPLRETASSDHSERTRMNIDESDGTLIIFINEMDEGTNYTRRYAEETGKPVYIIDEASKTDPTAFRNWMEENKIRVLNVAGPRESNEPGIYAFAMNVMGKIVPSAE